MKIFGRLKSALEKTSLSRILFFAFFDIVLISLAVAFAFLIRFEGKIPYHYIEQGIIQNTIFLSLIFCLPVFYFMRLYSFSWSFVSSTELISLFKAATLSFFFIGISIFVLKNFEGFPRSTLIISYFLVFIFCGGIRFAKRIYLEIFKKSRQKKEKTIIVGAGGAGEQILRSILSLKESPYEPIGFVDDSPAKQRILIHGLKVLGKFEDIPGIIQKYEVKEMIIALPSADSFAIKRAVELGRKAGLRKIKIVPPVYEIMKTGVSLGDLKDIKTETLLQRGSVEFDSSSAEKLIKNKKTFITGGAGSIGSELVRQVSSLSPSLLVVLDQDETGIFNISKEIKQNFPNIEALFIVGDINDKEKTASIFKQFSPAIVFHAAAYKHVFLMEEYPEEAVKNNIFGTKNLAEISEQYGVEKFVLISTDKAVNPSSVMGATKRAGEIICNSMNKEGGTKFISVRFGNVLDSRGSVVPIFKEQIRRGGPVEVSHPKMKRYFMTIGEAAALILQAAEIGKGGEVFVLDMGEPIKIIDLAKEMIRLSGFEPDKDIAIVFTEPKPGEKLFEEILTSEEGTTATKNKKIFIANLSSKQEKKKLFERLEELRKICRIGTKQEIKKKLKEIVPNYDSA